MPKQLTEKQIAYLANHRIEITTPESFPKARFTIAGTEYFLDVSDMEDFQILSIHNLVRNVAINVANKIRQNISEFSGPI
jgi:hypothetical protein